MSKKEWQKLAERLVFVVAGKNSYLGQFTGSWHGGVIVLKDAIASGMRQVMTQVGPSPQDVTPAQIPTPGLMPWIVNEPMAIIEVLPDTLVRFKYQSETTQETVATVYAEFLEHLREAREAPERKVQLHKEADLTILENAGRDPQSLLSQFGPLGKQ